MIQDERQKDGDADGLQRVGHVFQLESTKQLCLQQLSSAGFLYQRLLPPSAYYQQLAGLLHKKTTSHAGVVDDVDDIYSSRTVLLQ